MMKRLTASILKEDRFYVAQCLEVDVASQGNTEVEALGNLREALELHFERHPKPRKRRNSRSSR